ncbi:methionyl-tRNA formyltransferase [Planctomycetota bacterium]
MKIVFLGSGYFGVPSLDAMMRSRHEVVYIATQPPNPAGRGRRPCATPVADWADRHLVPYLETPNINTAACLEKIARHRPDLLVVIAFGQKIGSELIQLAPHQALNVHASLLPKWRGAAPINWSIIAGDETTGVTLITLADQIDAGEMLGTVETCIRPGETAGELHDRLAELAAPLLLETLDKFEAGTVEKVAQDSIRATMARKLKKADGYLDFHGTAEELDRRIRGFWPWPGAAATYLSRETGKRLRVVFAESTVEPWYNTKDLPTGTLNENLNIVCRRDVLRILRLKPAGKPLMEFSDFVNGRHTRPGDIFLPIETH